jgi:hypothetical protein
VRHVGFTVLIYCYARSVTVLVYCDARSVNVLIYCDARSVTILIYCDARSVTVLVYCDARSVTVLIYCDARSVTVLIYCDARSTKYCLLFHICDKANDCFISFVAAGGLKRPKYVQGLPHICVLLYQSTVEIYEYMW